MGKVATGRQDASGGGPIDWAALKKSIVGKLRVKVEYEKLGVRFTRSGPDAKGWIPCHAVGRPIGNPDEVPSAAVNVDSGVYHDSGDGGQSLGFFDFAMKQGEFGRWIDCIKHYAEIAGVEVGKFPTHGGGRIREAIYEYKDAAGAVRYAVFRYRLPSGKKTFTQHPPDGKGGWRTGAGCMDGIAPLPYRLPEMLSSPELPIWIVEGEKDADRLASFGLTATTSHGGTGNTDKAWPVIAHHFKGRDCRIVPDNDRAGTDHVRKVATYLHPHARSLCIVPLPGLPVRGDVSDWLDQGHTLAELQALADAAPEFDPAASELEPEADPTRDATAADLMRVLSATSWLAKPWIPNGCLTALAAEPGIGKTRLCLDIARRLYLGLPLFNGVETSAPAGSVTLWIPADNQHQELADIPGEFGFPLESVVLNTSVDDPFGGTSLETTEELADLEARIKRVKPALVIVDTITQTTNLKAQDPADAKRQYKPLQEIAARCQVPILCVTHLNASGKVLGRRAVEKSRVVIQMEQPDPGQEYRRKLWVSKSKAQKPAPLGVTMGGEGNEYDTTPPMAPAVEPNGKASGPPPARLREAVDWLRKMLSIPGSHRVSKILDSADAEGIPRGLLYRAKDQLGVVLVEDSSRKYWSLPEANESDGYDDSPF